MESDGGPLDLALCSARFLSASQILFFFQRDAPLLMRPRHFDCFCAVYSHDPFGISKSFREALVGWDRSFLSVAWPTRVELVFSFAQGFSKLFGALGSPSSDSLLNLLSPRF